MSPIHPVTPGLYLISPEEGDIVHGVVEVKGSVPDVNFDYAELSYSFADQDSSNWFLISRIENPVQDGTLATWDTSTISDGAFNLKLTVYQKNGNSGDAILKNIIVNNYTQIETPTETVQVIQQVATPNSTPTTKKSPEPTPLNENPASIDQDDIKLSIMSAVVLVISMLVILGIYIYFRNKARK